MDYRTFNVRTFLRVRILTGVGHTDESAQQFDSEQLSQIDQDAMDSMIRGSNAVRSTGHFNCESSSESKIWC